MSITAKDEKNIMSLNLDNGDRKTFLELKDKWKFKDEQSAMRFMMSIMVLSQDRIITINTDEGQQSVIPAANYTIQS